MKEKFDRFMQALPMSGRTFTRLLVLTLSLVLVLALAGCGGGSDTPDAVSPVRLSHKKEYVDVYTLDGLRVKRNVKRSKLSSTLRKGTYIIDGKKRVIK